jgi:WXG100 family type VII secretion target
MEEKNMAEFSVTIDQLKNVKDQLQEFNNTFNNQKKELAETGASLNTMWEGEAKDKFTEEFNRDQIQMGNFYNAIANYVTVLGNIIAQYEKAEMSNLDIATTRKY